MTALAAAAGGSAPAGVQQRAAGYAMHVLESVLRAAARLPAWAVLLLAGGFALGDSAFLLDFVVPGEAGMVFLGAVGRERGIPLPLLAAACAIGAVAGDSIGFLVGRRWGWALVERWRWTRKRLRPAVERAEEAFEKRRRRAVILGRWVGAFRAVVPIVAGTSSMPYRQFLLWDVISAVTWAPVAVTVGWFVGRPAIRLADRYDWLGLVVAAAIVAWLWHSHRREDGSARKKGARKKGGRKTGAGKKGAGKKGARSGGGRSG